MPSDLDAIGVRCGTDKASFHHNFLVFYEKFFAPLRHQAGLRILEIGVNDGASLRMWEEYFPSATIVGVDIAPDTLKHASPRCPVEIADQSDVMALARLVRTYGPFDIVIDDGSHFWHHQIASFRYLYASVVPGGYYVLEDIDTSYGTFTEGYKRAEGISAAEYMNKLCGYMVADRCFDLATEPDEFLRSYAPVTESISYYRRTCVLQRKMAG